MERIGFIGLGIMGKPMAHNLLAGGYPLTVLNRSAPAQDELVAAGARAGSSPRDVAEQSDVVITMLPDSPDVEGVMLGKDSVLEGFRRGGLVIDMSTIRPSTARRIIQAARERGSDGLDAPVSGGQAGAQSGTLSIMVGGSDSAFARAKPILDKMGKKIVHVGEAGAGQVAKAANQILAVGTIALVGEALLFASKAGADPAKVREALMGGSAQSRMLDVQGSRMLQRDFQPGFKAKLSRKDLAIVLDSARELGLALPIIGGVAELLNALIANDGGELDHSAMVTMLEKLGNFEIGSGIS